MSLDPAVSNAQFYKVVFENDRVRVLEYHDAPGDSATVHAYPDSVMITMSSFRRRLVHGNQERDVELEAGRANWLPAQQHRGINIGDTGTHAFFIELKEPAPQRDPGEAALGPSD